MKTNQSKMSTKLKVGIFTVIGFIVLGVLTVKVNDRPFWWVPCTESTNYVRIVIEDATGLRTKSPVQSLGLQIGYLKNVNLIDDKVELGICITAPVEVTSQTRAYLKSAGFLGDKFVELRPVKNKEEAVAKDKTPAKDKTLEPSPTSKKTQGRWDRRIPGVLVPVFGWGVLGLTESAYSQQQSEQGAEPKTVPVGDRSEDISSIVKQVDKLAVEMTELTTNLKDALNPEDIRQAIKQLNITLQNASKTLSPEGGLNTTAQRTLAKLEDAIEQFRDIMARINRGEGSVGRLINDPVYAEEVKKALENLNLFLNKASRIRLVIDFGAQQIPAYDGARGYFNVSIWPNPTRYYLVGVGIDPRGRLNIINTSTEGSNGALTTTRITQTEFNRPVLTGMLGKVFFHNRLEVAAGALYGDGTLSAALRLGPKYHEERVRFRYDFYSRPGPGFGLDHRVYVTVNPFMTVNFSGGLDSIHKQQGKIPYFVGASLVFDDDDIKSMFSLLL